MKGRLGFNDANLVCLWNTNHEYEEGLGFACPNEARWWIISKVKRFFWKRWIKQ